MHTKAVPRLGKPGQQGESGQAWYAWQPHAIAPSCELHPPCDLFASPIRTPACPDLAQLLQTAVAQAFNAVVITNAGAGW